MKVSVIAIFSQFFKIIVIWHLPLFYTYSNEEASLLVCESDNDCFTIRGVCNQAESVNRANFSKMYIQNEKITEIISCNSFVDTFWNGFEVSICKEKQCVLVKNEKESETAFKKKYSKTNASRHRELIEQSIVEKDYENCLINAYILSRINREDIKSRNWIHLCKELLE